MRALLISTYDLGRQPFGLASPAAWLREAGVQVACADLSRDRLDDAEVRAADLIGFFLPMHTATRLALPVIDRVRTVNPAARVCAFGLYAPLNERLLRERGISDVLGGEFEEELRDLALGLRQRQDAITDAGLKPRATLPRIQFRVPDRRGLPSLDRYASLQAGTRQRIVGYTEASRGCKHRCRHCPIVPIYDGRFRVVPLDVVMADVHAQVEAGAEHITFGDPDFFNGIGHATAIVSALAREWPALSYDVTIKIEHLLKHADRLPLLRDTGCAFVTSAVESVDDDVLRRLDKGHTRSDFERAAERCREIGLALAPTFVAFTPWTTISGYCDLLETIDRLDLVDRVAPVQLSIRLLVTEGSRLLELPEILSLVEGFDARSLTYPWRHPDPRVDALQHEIAQLAGVRLTAGRRELFARIWERAHAAAGLTPPARTEQELVGRAEVPYLNEPWYC